MLTAKTYRRLVLTGCLLACGAGVTHAIDVPFDPERRTLYTRDDLWTGYSSVPPNNSLDWKIFTYFNGAVKYAPPLNELRAQRKHDAGMEYAVNKFFKVDATGVPSDKRVVVIMGSHSRYRNDPWYARVAELAYALSKADYFVVSGGGPGFMEAAHLGAYMAKHYSPDDLKTALATLADSATPQNPKHCQPEKKQYEMCDYWSKANEVIAAFPKGGDSLGIPTWFYGHEGANAFSTHVAKFFSNATREEKLSSIGSHGVIFAPGGPGTAQEVFMDSAQNAYHSYNWMSPMVFFNEPDHYATRVMHDLVQYQTTNEYRSGQMLLISNKTQEIIAFLNEKQNRYCAYGDPECRPRQ